MADCVLDGNAGLDSDPNPNADDNCPAVSNSDQTDTDGDNIGNACDPPEIVVQEPSSVVDLPP